MEPTTITSIIPGILGTAVLLPLCSFLVIFLLGPRMGRHGEGGGFVALGAIVTSFALSIVSLVIWLSSYPLVSSHHSGEGHSDPTTHASSAEHGEPGEHSEPGALSRPEEHSTSAGSHESPAVASSVAEHSTEPHAVVPARSLSGIWYVLGRFGNLEMNIGYYVDSLTIAMFCMVSLIASCIHLFAMGYMHDELHDIVDHEVTLSDGSHLHRPGRYHRFFQYLSLFCFSMLGLIVAGNVAMTFVFWELVGICSYFLIGFYVERKSASTAANKAFIVNRVGDFGMIIGLMALWSSLGTFSYGDSVDGGGQVHRGLFSLVRPDAEHHPLGSDHAYELVVPDAMVRAGAADRIREIAHENRHATPEQLEGLLVSAVPGWRNGTNAPQGGYGYTLLLVAGLGIFCGCVGKSAQFPLHVWLPDAMEGPTPVSALVHSATMVAAGVFLVARFYPLFIPEVLLVIAVTGTITLFMAATIAIVATDIKRVLAYSTVSQLGYMMMSLGIGGWMAGVLHLFTHAFFKSLLFMCSGSVIHAVHTNEMPLMGGLRKKMPWTAYTMLVGCMAIAGAGIPGLIGLSGFYSKDAILAQALSFRELNPAWGSFFFGVAALGASITAFYMFRLWYLTFAGTPRDAHRFEHAHESPPIMYAPLVIISVFAIASAWEPKHAIIGAIAAATLFVFLLMRSQVKSASVSQGSHHTDHHDAHNGHHAHGADIGQSIYTVPLALSLLVLVAAGAAAIWVPALSLGNLLESARPAGIARNQPAALSTMVVPDESLSHNPKIHQSAGIVAFSTALAGFMLATIMYGWRKLDAAEVRQQFEPIYQFLRNKWWFDELYHVLFYQPTHMIAGWFSWIDRTLLDGLIHWLAATVRSIARTWDAVADRGIIDAFVNFFADRTYATGLGLRRLQTGSLRQYVMFIALGTIVLFLVIGLLRNYTFAQFP